MIQHSFLFFLIFSYAHLVFGGCHETIADGIQSSRDWCNDWNSCGSASFTAQVYMYQENSIGYIGKCQVTGCGWTQPEIFDLNGGPIQCDDDTLFPKNPQRRQTSRSHMQCGSIVHVENQIVGESIDLVDVEFNLNYFSNWAIGRTNSYKIITKIADSTPASGVTKVDLSILKNSSTVANQLYTTIIPNTSHIYQWDGTEGGSLTLGAREFEVIMIQYLGAFSMEARENLLIGGFKSKALGLGGWLPSNYIFLDPLTHILYRGDGSVAKVNPQNIGGGFRVIEEDGSLVYDLDSLGRVVSTKDGFLGITLFSFSYDTNGNLISVTNKFGQTTIFGRSLAGKWNSIQTVNGLTLSAVVDSSGDLESFTNDGTSLFEMSYHGTSGMLKTFKKPAGEISTFLYDVGGNLIKDSHSGGYFFDMVEILNSSGVTTVSTTSALNRTETVEVALDDLGIVRNIYRPSGANQYYSFAVDSGMNSAFEQKMNYDISLINEFEDDPRFPGRARRPLSSNLSVGSINRTIDTNVTYTLSNISDPFSIVTWQRQDQISGENTRVTTSYSATNKKFISSSYLGKTLEVTIDQYGRVVSTKVGNLEPVTYSYIVDKLTSISQGTRSFNLAYNNTTGLLESVTNSLSQSTVFSFDSSRRMSSIISPDLRTTVFSYDLNSRVVGVTPPGRPIHAFSYNGGELMSGYLPPALSGVTVVDTAYVYNLDKQLTLVNRPDGASIDYVYDSVTGLLTEMTTPEGVFQVTMNSDKEILAAISRPDNSRIEIGYTGYYPSTVTNYDTSGNFQSSYSKDFSVLGLVSSDTVTGTASSIISYQYNDDQEIKKAGDVNITYHVPNGYMTGTTMGSGSTGFTDTYSYNTYGEVIGYQAKYGTTVIYDLTVTRDAIGRVDGKTQTMNSVTDSFDYTFDSSGRLTQTNKNSVTVATYSYDSNSNRNGGTIGAQPTTATYDDQDRLLTYNTLSFTYNANGELTSKTNSATSQTITYTYDVFGNLRQVNIPPSTVITYDIDGLNRRIAKRVNGTVQRRWVYMDQYRIAAELNSSGAITKRFVYGSKGNIPDYVIASGVKYRIISDHLGSPRVVVRQSNGAIQQRMNHDEFGRVTEDTNPGFLPFGFAGGLYESQTGLVRFGARDYDPETGRWTSKDPILFGGGDTNLFGYVQNDPVNFIDPEGKFPLPLILGALAGIFYATDTDTPGAAQDEMIGVPMAAAGGWMAGGGICKATDTSIQYRNYPNSGGGGVGVYRNSPLPGQSKNIIRADVHPIKPGGPSVPHIDIPGVVKHWPWGK